MTGRCVWHAGDDYPHCHETPLLTDAMQADLVETSARLVAAMTGAIVGVLAVIVAFCLLARMIWHWWLDRRHGPGPSDAELREWWNSYDAATAGPDDPLADPFGRDR